MRLQKSQMILTQINIAVACAHGFQSRALQSCLRATADTPSNMALRLSSSTLLDRRHRVDFLVCDRAPVHAWSAVLSASYEVLCVLHRRWNRLVACARAYGVRVCSGDLWCAWFGAQRVYWAGPSWAQIPTSLYVPFVLDFTLRRVFCVLPVAKQPLVKRAFTKLVELLLSGYEVFRSHRAGKNA